MKENSVIWKRYEYDDIEGDCLKIIPLGDVHYGSPDIKMDLFLGTLDYIKDNGDVAVILMGDILEFASRRNASDVFTQTVHPSQQIEDMVEYLDPIKDKILCSVDGGHERRPYKDYGVSANYFMCKQLGIKYRYPAADVFISIGDYGNTQNYTIYATHGSSGAWTKAGKMKACMRLRECTEADIYLHGHVHELDTYTGLEYKPDWKNRQMYVKKRYYILTGHFLEWKGSYAERKPYPPGKNGVAKIKLFKDRWDIHVSV